MNTVQDGQLYEMTFIATGEVRDKDGNLISTEPVEAKTVITEDQYYAITGNQPEGN